MMLFKSHRVDWKLWHIQTNMNCTLNLVFCIYVILCDLHPAWKMIRVYKTVRRNLQELRGGHFIYWYTLTRSAELLKRPIRRTQFRMGSLLSSNMLWVHIGGWHCRWVAKMARFIMVKSSLSSIFDISGSCPLKKTAVIRLYDDAWSVDTNQNQLQCHI